MAQARLLVSDAARASCILSPGLAKQVSRGHMHNKVWRLRRCSEAPAPPEPAQLPAARTAESVVVSLVGLFPLHTTLQRQVRLPAVQAQGAD